MKKSRLAVFCKLLPSKGDVMIRFFTVLALLLGIFLILATPMLAAQSDDQTSAGANWTTWAAENYNLAAKEAFQFSLTYNDIAARRFRLVVDGGDWKCDLSVLRVRDESLVYFKTDESHHEIEVPWGIGEELMIHLKNRDHDGAFVVSLLGPPEDQGLASYSYYVNRSLEAYAVGSHARAEELCRKALSEDPDDAVAKVLMAGFRRNDHFYEQASLLVAEALEADLPEEMRSLAQTMRTELRELQAPLSKPLAQGVHDVEAFLEDEKGEPALDICNRLLNGDLDLSLSAKARLLMLRGQALVVLEKNFEAVESFTQALQYARPKATQALIYYEMGLLFNKMKNYEQAEGAYTIALNQGLPTSLEMQARETLRQIQDHMDKER